MSIHNRNSTENFYREIIQKVCNNVKEDFHNEGIGEDVIQDLSRIIRPGMDPNYSANTNLIKYGINLDLKPGCNFYGMNHQHTHNHLGANLMPVGGQNPLLGGTYFKSDPNKTTADNISVYLEKKMGSLENKPKFSTINTGNGNQNKITNINFPPENLQILPINNNHGQNINTAIKNEELSDVDSDLDVFEGQKETLIKKEENEENLEDESLSSISNDSEYIEAEAKDFLLAQYDKVHRVRNKWKCTFKDAVLHINGKEYVFEKVVGELERDW